MRLFHVSEDPNITEFIPRTPVRGDLDKSIKLVWAINEKCLPNFFTPRECPRVTYHSVENTTEEDISKFFTSTGRHCVTIENAWFEKMMNTNLYVYEFDPNNFYLQDQCAGYYVSEHIEVPINKIVLENLFGELFKRNIEVRIVDNLWKFADEIKKHSMNYSICDMAYAQPRI